MKVKGVDHPLQHVLGALSALCEERKKIEKSRKRMEMIIISLWHEKPNSKNRTNRYRKLCNVIKMISLELKHSESNDALMTTLSKDSNGEAWKK